MVAPSAVFTATDRVVGLLKSSGTMSEECP
ncbi:Uncharacterised protein [Mycobacteroides abscessus subsp. abscessus]|nr:Uncharacterised protein [Mycobacteroides abscessus subsp. abscessus]